MPTLAQELLQTMREAVSFAKGEADPAAFVVHVPEDDAQNPQEAARVTGKTALKGKEHP